jgi:hypothetical protein
MMDPASAVGSKDAFAVAVSSPVVTSTVHTAVPTADDPDATVEVQKKVNPLAAGRIGKMVPSKAGSRMPTTPRLSSVSTEARGVATLRS